MAHEETQRFDPELVHRYFDGDLDADERRDAEALLERSPAARAMLAGLDRQRALLRATADDWAAQLSARGSEDLFARIQAELPAPARSSAPTAARPALRAIPGGRLRIYAAVTVVLAAAAAALLWVRQATPSGGADTEHGQLAAHVRGSEVIAADFGRNAGTVFNVEGQAGEALAVVWISDQVEKP